MSFWDRYIKDNRIDLGNLQERANKLQEWFVILDGNEYSKFLRSDKHGNILKLLDESKKSVHIDRPQPDRRIDMSKDMKFDFVLEFYKKYMPSKFEEVKSILNGTHPLFIDKNGKTHINIRETDKHENFVGHHRDNDFLDLSVCLNGTVNDLIILPHEISHALSSHHQTIAIEQRNKTQHKFPPTAQDYFATDCVGEIEAFITEKLMLNFLVEKGILSKKDVESYYNKENNSLMYEIDFIKKDDNLVQLSKKHGVPINDKSLKAIAEEISTHKQIQELEHLKEKQDSPQKNDRYFFRYAAARIVSQQWINVFNASTKEEQKQMLNNFSAYLGKTNNLQLNDACEILLDKSFEEVASNYTNKNEVIKTL